MKRLLCLLVCLFGSLFGWSQPGTKSVNDTTIVQKGNRKEITVFNKNAGYKEIIRTKNGKLDGWQEVYSSNGKIIKKKEYKDGHLNGQSLSYDYEGNLAGVLPYKYLKDQKRSVLYGEAIVYRNQKIQTITTYKDSLKEGVFRYFSPEGKLSQEGFYTKGKKSGLWKQFFPNGKIESEIDYKDDKVHGTNIKYDASGQILSRAVYYEEIEINGKKLKNIYDGKREEYSRTGKLTHSENYVLGSKEGLFQYYYETGILRQEGLYKNNLQTGIWKEYDNNGSLYRETNYEIVQENGVGKSVKTGYEYYWKNKVLITKLHFENGVEQGLRESFYDSGKPNFRINIVNGHLEGDYIEYYENGQIKSKQQYIYNEVLKQHQEFGWRHTYDQEGNLTTQLFTNKKKDQTVSIVYKKGIPYNIEIDRLFSFSCFPSGELKSFKFKNFYNQPVFAAYYYQNHNLRKLIYQDPSALKENQLVFNDKGNYQHEYADYYAYYDKENTLQLPYADIDPKVALKVNETVKKEYINTANPDWTKAKLFTDKVKNGKYELQYANNKPFIQIEFKDNLPQGKWVVFEPTQSDTLLYRNFNQGEPVSDYLEKFAGKIKVRQNKYYENGQMAFGATIFKDGRTYEKVGYDETGKQTYRSSFHKNGKLEVETNETNNTYTRYSDKGIVQEEKKILPNRENWSVLKRYYKDTPVLQSESFYFKQKTDSIYSQFFDTEKLQYKATYKDGKRNGKYEEYKANGELKLVGQYVNDVMDGHWINYDGTAPKKMFYKNGNLQVVPTEKKCECVDTLYSNSKVRFAQTVDDLVTFSKLRSYLPPFIKPINNFNYDSIFFINFQTSNGNNSGFSSMKLLMFKPFSFYLPSDQQLKITLNPCITQGYISTMDINANYTFDDTNRTYATLYPKRISFELVNSPLKSNEKDFENFTAFYDVDDVYVTYEDHFAINYKKDPKACFSLAKIKDYLFVDVLKAKPMIFEKPSLFDYPNVQYKKEEMENFFGINIQESTVSFDLMEEGKMLKMKAKGDELLAGGKFVTGKITIPCKKTKEDSFEAVVDKETIIFSSQNLKKEWMKKGFTRINIMYNEVKSQLEVYFFAE